MKKASKLFITGSAQGIFYEQFIKESADKLGIRGFLRKLEDGRFEIFIEGNHDNMEQMLAVCKRDYKHAKIRNVEEKPEKFQGFKEFKILKI
ncbi:acylphosphatase [Candidatus Pacearchaeota archaeon]|nr:acylphosphatase [Candidatus Pacearchaeota archaeon]